MDRHFVASCRVGRGGAGITREHGITAVVSKGPGIARFYPALNCRPYSDLAVVLAPRDFARGVAVLETLG